MRLSTFPLCCKSGILWSFPEGDRHEHKKATLSTVRCDLATKIKESWWEDHLQVVIILSEGQDMARTVIEDELGFEPVHRQDTNAYGEFIDTYVISLSEIPESWLDEHRRRDW